MDNARRIEALADWVNLALAIVLFVAPWGFGYTNATAASWNAWISGAVIAIIAIAALSAYAQWEEWLNIVLGIWVAVSPWVLGYQNITSAAWVALIVGALVALIALAHVVVERPAAHA